MGESASFGSAHGADEREGGNEVVGVATVLVHVQQRGEAPRPKQDARLPDLLHLRMCHSAVARWAAVR
jgi:hypothetical protein